MENLRGFPALKRSKDLVKRSLGTTVAAVALLFVVPLIIGASTGGIVALTVERVVDVSEKVSNQEKQNEPEQTGAASQPPAQAVSRPSGEDLDVNLGKGGQVKIGDESSTMTRRIARVVRESLTTVIMLPIQIFLTSISSIIIALLYLKTRQAGGENLRDLFGKFEETEQTRKKWQERVQQRLIQSGRVTSRPT
jgi:hypothetical protein